MAFVFLNRYLDLSEVSHQLNSLKTLTGKVNALLMPVIFVVFFVIFILFFFAGYRGRQSGHVGQQ